MDAGAVHVDGTLAAGAVEIFAGGVGSGSGTVDANLVLSGGNLAPGNSAGTLTVDGNYIQNAGSTLEIQLGGSTAGQFDVLAVSGSAQLEGALNVSLIEGFTPALETSFTILTATSVIEDLTLTGAPGFNLITSATSLTLQYVGVLEAATTANGPNVPEPTSATLFLASLVTLLGRSRRRPR
jgi:hypothetical protein